MGTAQTGRTHDLHPTASRKPKESLDPWAPSTHDPQRHWLCTAAIDLTPVSAPIEILAHVRSTLLLGDELRRHHYRASIARHLTS